MDIVELSETINWFEYITDRRIASYYYTYYRKKNRIFVQLCIAPSIPFVARSSAWLRNCVTPIRQWIAVSIWRYAVDTVSAKYRGNSEIKIPLRLKFIILAVRFDGPFTQPQTLVNKNRASLDSRETVDAPANAACSCARDTDCSFRHQWGTDNARPP